MVLYLYFTFKTETNHIAALYMFFNIVINKPLNNAVCFF